MTKKSIFYTLFCFLALGGCTQSKTNNLVGQKAPEFSAKALYPDGSVKEFKLSDYEGKKVVLYFYPADNTPGCSKQAQNFRDGIAKLEAEGITLVGISCDSIEAHKRFQKKFNLPYILVSDSRLHRTIGKKFPGTISFGFYKRKTFLINEQGIVFKRFDKIKIESQIDDILAAFAEESQN